MKHQKTVTDSQFYMWRTVFAIVHADQKVTDEEVRFMAEILEDMPFSEAQRGILKEDARTPRDIEEMYQGITDVLDQAAFFRFARQVVWVDGDFGQDEQDIMLRLQEIHVRRTDLADLVGKVELELEDENAPQQPAPIKDKKKIVQSFRQKFLRDLERPGKAGDRTDGGLAKG